MENKQNFLIPASIIIAGLIVGFAIVGKDSIVSLLKGGNKDLGKEGTGTAASSSTAPKSPSTASAYFKEYAKELGLNTEQFNSCLDSEKYKDQINQSVSAGNSIGVSGTPASFVDGMLLSGAQPYENFKALLDKELGTSQSLPALFEDYKKQGYFSDVKKEISLNNFAGKMGDDNAKVTLVEFTDFQCPFCERHTTTTVPQIIKDYVNTGKVKYYIMDYPLTQIHPNAFIASEAARCAAEQGKYWEMYDKIFTTQTTWESVPAR